MAEAVSIPRSVAQTVAEIHGQEGRSWLNGLPGRIEEATTRWSLRLGEPLAPLSYSYAVAVTRADGTPAVLKASFPGGELPHEVAALRAFDGRGAARLLEANAEAGLVLLERLLPGTSLEAVSEDMAAAAFCGVLRELHCPMPVGHAFPTTRDWTVGLRRLRGGFGGETGPFSPALVSAAESLFDELHASAAPSVLLHGDLHHGNVLASARAPWLAIDPKGVIGEPAYEVGAFLRNPMPALLSAPDPSGMLSRRVDQISQDLGLDRDRLLAWGAAQAVLSGWWSYEDHGSGWQPWMRCAETLFTLLSRGVAR